MIKHLSLLSISSVALLAVTQAHGHVLCAPKAPQAVQQHQQTSHTLHKQLNNKNLQAQRARQQKALANQQRINQKRRMHALARQQQEQARKAAVIHQQRLAAKRAQAERQQASLAASKRVRTQHRQYTNKPVYYQASILQHVRHAPTRTYRPVLSAHITKTRSRQPHKTSYNIKKAQPHHKTSRHYNPRKNAHITYRYSKHSNNHRGQSHHEGRMKSGRGLYSHRNTHR